MISVTEEKSTEFLQNLLEFNPRHLGRTMLKSKTQVRVGC